MSINKKIKPEPWCSYEIEDIFVRVNSSLSGLPTEEAAKRLAQYGKNILPVETSRSTWKLILAQFANPLMYLMALAVAVSLYLSNLVEGVFILIVMVSNALVGFYQEHKANKSLQALKSMIRLRARVLRDNIEVEIGVEDIVPGDILILRAGDKIPADGRIIEAREFRVNEASLTGEAKPIEKTAATIAIAAQIADQTNMVFMGTFVETGSANILILETGVRTQYGDIVTMLKETPEEQTPLQLAVISLSKFIGIFISIVISALIIEGYLAGQSFPTIFETALALFVSAIPEGLLPAITIILVLGMRRILHQRGLVRRLAATETLGSVTVICTDKTGTLTEGKMEAESILTADGTFPVTATSSALTSTAGALIINGSVLATDAYIENPLAEYEELVVRGNFTEQALLRMAYTFGVKKHELEQTNVLTDTLFFSSERKYSASLRQVGEQKTLYVVGAFEKMSEYLTTVLVGEETQLLHEPSYHALIDKKDEAVKAGYRVLAFAYRTVSGEHNSIAALLNEGLTLAGFVTIIDPIRDDVPEAFVETRQAGVKTVIVTGDHKFTARAVAEKIGLAIADEDILEGVDIEAMDDGQLREHVKTVLLYARVSPRHKLRIVQALQENGEVVAMFGDGVNDAPALKAADIGVAVETQVVATQEVADIVLLDGGFNTIIKSIEQGRIIFSNIRKIFLYLITQDFSQFFIFIASILFGLPLPLSAAQLLLINLVESGLPDLALTTEQEKEGIMNEPPRKKTESILNQPVRQFMISVFIISGLSAFLFYVLLLQLIPDPHKVRTMIMVLFSLESLFLAFSMRSFTKRIFRNDIFSNRILVAAVIISLGMVLCTVYVPALQKILITVPLQISDWGLIISVNLIIIILVDGIKLRLFKAHRP